MKLRLIAFVLVLVAVIGGVVYAHSIDVLPWQVTQQEEWGEYGPVYGPCHGVRHGRMHHHRMMSHWGW